MSTARMCGIGSPLPLGSARMCGLGVGVASWGLLAIGRASPAVWNQERPAPRTWTRWDQARRQSSPFYDRHRKVRSYGSHLLDYLQRRNLSPLLPPSIAASNKSDTCTIRWSERHRDSVIERSAVNTRELIEFESDWIETFPSFHYI
jgi:hypothetical protein